VQIKIRPTYVTVVDWGLGVKSGETQCRTIIIMTIVQNTALVMQTSSVASQ
jgi:hypothetical protein